MKRFLKIFAGLIGLLILFYGVENWRGSRALEKAKLFLTTEGEEIEFSAKAIEPVSPSDNFFGIPLLAPLFDFSMDANTGEITYSDQEAVDRYLAMRPPPWEVSEAVYLYEPENIDLEAWRSSFERAGGYDLGDPEASPAEQIQNALSRFDEDFSALAAAATERSVSRFPLPVQQGSSLVEDYGRRISAYPRGTLGFHEFLAMKGILAIEQNDPATALDCVRIQLKFSQAFDAEDTLMALVLRAGCFAMIKTVIHHGLARDCWSEDDLKWIDQHLADIDLLDHCLQAARGELRFYLAAVDHSKSTGDLDLLEHIHDTPFYVQLVPAGWWDQNAAMGADLIYRHAVLPFKERNFAKLDDDEWGNAFEATTPYNLLARVWLYYWTNVAEDILAGQAEVDGLRIACALQRFHLATARYPDSLNDLAPTYLKAIPTDPFSWLSDVDGGDRERLPPFLAMEEQGKL